tara:strand:- start:259 stop:534 length:276 start_codon:yes stop_codon:yes gene_type:complete
MPEEVKFSKEEMETLEEIQKKYASIQLQLGQLGFTKIRLENEIKIVNENEGKLKSEFNKVQSEEKTFMDSLTSKYGEGTLDPKTGVFSVNK